MGTYERGAEIVGKLEAAGVRATVNPALANPPCVLVIPPNLVMDLNCAVTAEWQLVALAATAQAADANTWQALDVLVDAAVTAVDVESADLVSYVVNGRTYPAYLLSFTEGI